MDGPTGEQSDSIQKQLSRSLGTVWEQHTGGRPAAVSTEISGDVVKCSMEDTDTQPSDAVSYKNDAIAVVAKATGRKVRGFVPKHSDKTDLTTGTFILEPPRVYR